MFEPITAKVLGHGEVSLVDVMGDDQAIIDAARISYGEGTRKVSDSRGLIRYLMRHQHTSPFEMVELKFYVKLPIFVARQWIRHRTANVNEYSGRYSAFLGEWYEVADYYPQAEDNKQGTDLLEPVPSSQDWVDQVSDHIDRGFQIYNGMTASGVNISREDARIHLPLSTYTKWVWKIDLHNLFHFLKLRTDPHAQHQIRAYAEAMLPMVQQVVPLAYEAWEDYNRKAVVLSRMELEIMQNQVRNVDSEEEFRFDLKHNNSMSLREKREFYKLMVGGEYYE